MLNRPEPNRDQESKKRQEEEEVAQVHREEQRKDSERRRQQNVTQGFNTGTEDVQRVSDWGTVRHTKKRKK